MADASIPAWKRAGLKQVKQTPKKAQAGYDPLKEGLKRAHESSDTAKPPKPAKRTKVPKADRPASTHEPDQLAYLRQYHEERDNWKFSKQKQNWILKHLFTEVIDARYEPPLMSYIEGLVGSARNWVSEDARKVVNEWNAFMQKDLESTKDDESETITKDADRAAATSDEPSKEASGATGGKAGNLRRNKGAPVEKQPVVPTEKLARRAQKVLELLTKEYLPLEFLDKAEPEQGG